MDGIFGVGLAEMLIIGLALFIVGGPKNSAKWARELGRMVRQVREAWAQVMADIEKEVGPEGKEIMDAARELGQGARDMRSMNPTRKMLGETMRMVESSVSLDEETPATPARPESPAMPTGTPTGTPSGAPPADTPSAANGKKYAAWQPPENQNKT